MSTCATLPCSQVMHCCLAGGCVQKRFPEHCRQGSAIAQEPLRADAPALNGTKPGRTNRDPTKIKRRRKDLRGPNPLRHRR